MDLDLYSLAILAELQRDARQTVHQLSEAVGLSPTPCWKRVKELEAAVVIRGYSALVDREMVEVSTVDEFMAKLDLPALDLLKVDTQGFDLAVLKGAGGALASGRVRTVLVELNFVRMYQGQASAQEITEYLAQHGLYLIDCYDKAREGHTLGWCCALFGRR